MPLFAPDASPEAHHSDRPSHHDRSLWLLILGSVGVVFGDIGTSPLYAMRESLAAAAAGGVTDAEITGIVSLLLWTLVIIVTLKYVLLIMRADNNGEGGTLSLLALAQRALGRRPDILLLLGIAGTALFFGDAIITPAISVLAAVEGLTLVTPAFDGFVVPIALGVIVGLFWIQRRGTDAVSRWFGPVTLVWFIVMGLLGALHIADHPGILMALNPAHALGFLWAQGFGALAVMGSVFLAVTGAEALYADMGHFGRIPIRIAWNVIVFPALALSYLGQGGLVISDHRAIDNPFFLLAPDWALLPLVLLATVATVIASQAVISGAFSIARQAVQLGLLPRLEVRHTSARQIGQVFMPQVNLMLFFGVIFLVVTFGSSTALASAYGIAVTGDMVITTLIGSVVFRNLWGWPLWLVVVVVAPLLAVEGTFLVANLMKVADGGWMPLLFAAVIGILIRTWLSGTAYVQRKSRSGAISIGSLVGMLAKSRHLAEAPGTAVFLTAEPDVAPTALMHNLKHNHVLHRLNLIVTVTVAPVPYVPDAERLTIEKLDDRFTRVRITFGYMDEPNVPRALTLARREGQKFDTMAASYFLNRRTFRPSPTEGLPRWQERLFIGLSRSASAATDFYRLPVNRVVELGQQLAI